jgi:hypothetical protein
LSSFSDWWAIWCETWRLLTASHSFLAYRINKLSSPSWLVMKGLSSPDKKYKTRSKSQSFDQLSTTRLKGQSRHNYFCDFRLTFTMSSNFTLISLIILLSIHYAYIYQPPNFTFAYTFTFSYYFKICEVSSQCISLPHLHLSQVLWGRSGRNESTTLLSTASIYCWQNLHMIMMM